MLLFKLYRAGAIELLAPQNNNSGLKLLKINSRGGAVKTYPCSRSRDFIPIKLERIQYRFTLLLSNELAGTLPCHEWLKNIEKPAQSHGCNHSVAVWKVGSRDAWIGWSASIRKRNLHLIVNNFFLILLWVNSKNHAFHVFPCMPGICLMIDSRPTAIHP